MKGANPVMNRQGRFFVLFFGVTLLFAMTASTAFAEQVWNANKSNGCRFSIPVHAKDLKITEIRWDGPCKDNLADGEGPLQIKFYQIPNEKNIIIIDGTMTMVGGVPNGKALLRWNFGLALDAEYKDGERVRGTMRYNGESYEGEFYLDAFHGKGVYRYKNGEVYDGDWVAGKRSGFGKLIAPDGKVKYQGEWSNNYPANDLALTRTLKGFINIPWGVSREDAEKTLKNRPDNYLTANLSFFKNNVYWGSSKAVDGTEYTYFLSKFNGEPAFIFTYSYQDKFFLGRVVFFNTEQDIISNFETVKKDLSERYGAPTKEIGKFMDSVVIWEFQEGNFINLNIQQFGYAKKNFIFNNQDAALRDIVKRPFNLVLSYGYGPVYKKLYTFTTTTKTDY
jgi:hypothetical protein